MATSRAVAEERRKGRIVSFSNTGAGRGVEGYMRTQCDPGETPGIHPRSGTNVAFERNVTKPEGEQKDVFENKKARKRVVVGRGCLYLEGTPAYTGAAAQR